MMEVSVVIINYNTFQLTCKCIDSLIEHTGNISYEIILVDNASQECDPQLFADRFPSIKLIRSEKNLGFAGGNNLGIHEARGEYILLLNSDVIVLNDILSETVSAMQQKNVSLATCQVFNEDRSRQSTCAFFPSVRLSILSFLGIVQLSRKLGFSPLAYRYDYSTAHRVDWIWGCFFLFKKKILLSFSDGKLPEDFFMYAEDLLWCYKLHKKGVDAWYLPGGKIIHLFSGNKLNMDPEVNLNFRHYVMFMKRNYPVWKYSLIFFFDSLTALTRLKQQHLFKKIKLYYKLR